MFKIGDIIYAYPHRAGCSEYVTFAVVEKVTPLGRIRIREIGKITKNPPKRVLGELLPISIRCKVVPNPLERATITYTLNKEGERIEGSHGSWAYFEKYTEDLELYDVTDVTDFGD